MPTIIAHAIVDQTLLGSGSQEAFGEGTWWPPMGYSRGVMRLRWHPTGAQHHRAPSFVQV